MLGRWQYGLLINFKKRRRRREKMLACAIGRMRGARALWGTNAQLL